MRNKRTLIIKGTISFLLLFVAIFCFTQTNQLNHGIAPFQTSEEDPTENHGENTTSQLDITGREKLDDYFGEPATEIIANRLYVEQYQRTSQLERRAELIDFKKSGEASGAVTIEFKPSNQRLTAKVTVRNAATNDIDITIGGAKQ